MLLAHQHCSYCSSEYFVLSLTLDSAQSDSSVYIYTLNTNTVPSKMNVVTF